MKTNRSEEKTLNESPRDIPGAFDIKKGERKKKERNGRK